MPIIAFRFRDSVRTPRAGTLRAALPLAPHRPPALLAGRGRRNESRIASVAGWPFAARFKIADIKRVTSGSFIVFVQGRNRPVD